MLTRKTRRLWGLTLCLVLATVPLPQPALHASSKNPRHAGTSLLWMWSSMRPQSLRFAMRPSLTGLSLAAASERPAQSLTGPPVPAGTAGPAQQSQAPARHAAPSCAPVVRTVMPLRDRLDSLLVLGDGETVVALAGATPAGIRFLPHDALLVLSPRRQRRVVLPLPSYITPPGLVVAGTPPAVYVIVDSAMLRLDLAAGRLVPVARLDMQAIGWPTAVAALNGRLYVVGQPRTAWAAAAEAFALSPLQTPRLLWRASLGLTHAGIWLAPIGHGRLDIYLPDTHDMGGSIALLDPRDGALHGAYTVSSPPIAADPAHNRLYLSAGEAVRALTLDRGRSIATLPAGGPLALDPARGLVAVATANGITLATASTLRPLAHLALRGVTALAAAPDGRILLAGATGGLARIDLGACRA